MILWGNEQHWYPFTKTLRQIYEQDPKPNLQQSVVIVLVLAENRESKIKEIIETMKVNLKDLVSNGYVQLIVSKFDSHPQEFINIKEEKFDFVNDVSSLMNYRLAFLLRHCSGIAENAMLIDSEWNITQSAMKRIYNEIDTMTWNVLNVDLGSTNRMQKLYQGRYLPRVYGTFYSLAQIAIVPSIMNMIEDSSIHAEKRTYRGEVLIKPQAPPAHRNPPATVTHKIQAAGGTDVQDFYLHKGPSWFVAPKQGDYVTVTLDEPSKLRRIYVETGLDSFKRDVFNHAVLELSYSKNTKTKQCAEYGVVSSFEDKSVIVISNDDAKTSDYLIKPVHCINIRVTKNCRQWTSIKTLIIQKDE